MHQVIGSLAIRRGFYIFTARQAITGSNYLLWPLSCPDSAKVGANGRCL